METLTVIAGLMLLVAAPLLIWWFSARLRKREVKRRRQRLTPLVGQQYDSLVSAIGKEYPFIRFSFPSVQSLLDDCQTLEFEFPPRPHIQEALMPLTDYAREALLNAPLNLDNETTNIIDTKESAIQKGIGDQEFWASESEHRATKGGRLPSDWSIRRQVVHARDNGQCRRCGLGITLAECHIHHLTRKSQGGAHSFENLVALCRGCHALMPGHEGMKADMYYESLGERLYYYVSHTGTIHQGHCQHARTAKRVSDLYTRLLERGHQPCKRCDPARRHEKGVQNWTPQIARFVEESIGICHGGR